jgi:hypothetical protein
VVASLDEKTFSLGEPLRAKSVTYGSETFCYPCLGNG